MDKYMIVDNRYIDKAQTAWGDNYEIIPSISCDTISEPVCAHPDMVLFKSGEKNFICAPEVYEKYCKILIPLGVNLICGTKKLSCHYPWDIAYNVFKTDKFALGKFSETDTKILQYLDDEKIEMININQGYAKCSTCAFDGGVISADGGICSAASKKGLDVLKIPCGEIRLLGYDYGFIGGASGINSDGDVFFFGDLDSVSFGKQIYDFIKRKGRKILQIKDFPLTDVGTIMFFWHAAYKRKLTFIIL